ncbi:MAG: hypothetical protein JSS57_20950 [Proteobacteria bacterium]|nr:hypothetical protein [Pseudomonadota bacterium]
MHRESAAALAPLVKTWLGLLALTGLSLVLGHGLHGQAGLQWLVAALLWLKGWLVIHHFIEADSAHPLIRRVLYGFITITPALLLVTALFGRQLARLTTL